MQEPDPLAETDIYATIKKAEEPVIVNNAGDPEETELEDDLNDVFAKSFTKEKAKQNFVKEIPQILMSKKEDNFNNMFQGISVQDIANVE